MTYRHTITKEGMDVLAIVTFLTGGYGAAPTANVRLIAPLYPDVINIDVKLPDALYDLSSSSESIARQCVDIAWRNDLDPWYLDLHVYNPGPMDPISLYYRKHPREAA